jgi:hypothetical protein
LHLQNNAIFNHAAEEENTNVKIKYQEKYNLSKQTMASVHSYFVHVPLLKKYVGDGIQSWI